MIYRPAKIEWMHRMWRENPERKFQTRRVKREHEELVVSHQGDWVWGPVGKATLTECYGWRIKWQVGRDYAVQPGRGKHGVWVTRQQALILNPPTEWQRVELGYRRLRMLVTDIREERLQEISPQDAWAEGIDTEYVGDDQIALRRGLFANMWDGIYKGQPEKQWQANPTVFAITFRLRAM